MKHQTKETVAKFWDLLRRNDCFHKAVARLTELASRLPSEDKVQASRAREIGDRMLRHLDRRNPFAAVALRWLVPDPLFLHQEVALPRDFDPKTQVSEFETIRLGRGFTPDPKDDKHWKWFVSGEGHRNRAFAKANRAGWPMRWGPEIERITTEDPRLKHVCQDGIAEWQEYFANHRFSLDTPWQDTPPGFKRVFHHLWARFPGGSHEGHETSFFQDWDLGRMIAHFHRVVDAANRCIKELARDLERVRRGESEKVCPPSTTTGGNSMRSLPQLRLEVTETQLAKINGFEQLAKQRVFAVPHPLTSTDAKTAFAELGQQVARELPNQRELLGTPEFWQDFRAVDAIQREENVDTDIAIHRHIRRSYGDKIVRSKTHGTLTHEQVLRWVQGGELLPRPTVGIRDTNEWSRVKTFVAPTLRAIDANYRTTVKTRVDYMRALCRAAFPKLDFVVLTQPPLHKRKRRR